MRTEVSRGRRGLTRREFGKGALALGASALVPLQLRAEGAAFSLPEVTKSALQKSRLVYVSPLDAEGGESRCHGEVWFFVDGGDVVLATASDTWKARAVAKGRDRARIWVGDFGPVGRAGDRFRAAPEFLAKVRVDRDPESFERLMQSFATKYADEWGKWGPRFRKGYDDGTRILLRYEPVGA